MGVLHETLARLVVAEKLGNGALKRVSIVNLHCSAIRNQCFSQRCEVFHMRTKDNRFTRENGLYRILSPVRGDAFPDEYHSGDTVPALKFTSRIEEYAIHIGCATGERFAGERHTQWQSAQLRTDFLQPFDMTRRDKQPQRWKLLAQPKKNSGQDFFFTGVRAA